VKLFKQKEVILQEVKIKLQHKDVKVPTYATDGSGCFDIYAELAPACISCVVMAGQPTEIETGLYFEIPEGKSLLVFSRSGHGFRNDVRLANAVGVIDSDYRGMLKVKLTADGDGMLVVNHGDRIAQGMIIDTPKVTFKVVDELSETKRGFGGFGSTG